MDGPLWGKNRLSFPLSQEILFYGKEKKKQKKTKKKQKRSRIKREEGMIQDSPGQGDTRIRWYIEYPYQKNFVRKAPLTVQGYQVVPKKQLCVSGWDIL